MMKRAALVLLALALTACPSERADWNRKDSHQLCKAAIAAFPATAAPPCSAMHLCANEAILSPAEQKKLAEMVVDAGCPPL